MYVNRLRLFQAPALELLPAPVIPPLMAMLPGWAPSTNDKLAGKLVRLSELNAKPAREKPARNVLRMLGENTCVSSRLATCSLRWRAEANSGSASGITLWPSSMVYDAEKRSWS